MRTLTAFRYFILAASLVLLYSCDEEEGVLYQDYTSVGKEGWKADEPASFAFSVSDTTTPVDVMMLLRTTTNYGYQNIIVFLSLDQPNGRTVVDTIQFTLADPAGRFNGDVTGTVVENRLRFITARPFTQVGEYKLSIAQAMRDETLKEVMDVGFRIQETGAAKN